MDLGISGKNALVCGGSRGIGRAVADRLAAEGANVTVVSRTATDGVRADLSTAAGCEAAVRGAGPVDLLLLNAGGPSTGGALDFSDEQWESAFALNFLSVVRIARLVLPGMTARGFGRVVAITSVSAIEPIPNLVLSNAMRPAVHGFLKTLASEAAPFGITVNAVAPGYTATERMKAVVPLEKFPEFEKSLPLRRLVDPNETASAVAYLMSSHAAAITGIVLPCDGGILKSI